MCTYKGLPDYIGAFILGPYHHLRMSPLVLSLSPESAHSHNGKAGVRYPRQRGVPPLARLDISKRLGCQQ